MRQKAQKRRNIDLKQTNILHFSPKKLRFLLQENKVPIKKTTILHPKKSKKRGDIKISIRVIMTRLKTNI